MSETIDDMADYTCDPTKIRKSELPDGSEYALEALNAKGPTTVGNAAAMREALDKIARCMDEILVRTELDSIIHRKALEAQNLADGALIEPPRNCDVGLASEQSRRFLAFCRPRTEPCDGCACLEGASKGRCEFIWGQMPYEEGGTE